jgi:hypothetical protein
VTVYRSVTAHLYLLPRSRMEEAYLYSPTGLYGTVLKELCIRKNLPFFTFPIRLHNLDTEVKVALSMCLTN